MILMNKNRKNGVTLLELIIALGLVGMVIVVIFFFFISNQKTLRSVEIKSNLQYEAKIVIEKLSKYALEATSGRVDPYEGDTEKISFDLLDENNNKVLNGAVFKKDDNQLKLILNDKNGNELSSSILSEYIKSINAEVNQIRDSISIDLVLENKGIIYSVKENYLFRNNHID